MVFEDNDGELDDENALLHAKRWDVYMNEKENLFKVGYLVEVFSHNRKKVLWEVVDDHIVEDTTDHDEIGLRGFDLNVSDKDEEGVVRGGSSEFPYLLMLIELRPGDCMTQLKRMNQKVDKDNGKH